MYVILKFACHSLMLSKGEEMAKEFSTNISLASVSHVVHIGFNPCSALYYVFCLVISLMRIIAVAVTVMIIVVFT